VMPPSRIRPTNPSRSAHSSPGYSVVELPSHSSFASSDLGPPPSQVGTSSSAPPTSSPSQQLEISILRSQLEAARILLSREQTRSREALDTQAAQFSQEREAYLAYIKTLEGRQ
jgi:hypothetical protein